MKIPKRPTNGKPRKMGRPPIFTPELGDAICREISGGKSMRAVCAQPGMPDRDTVFAWLRGAQGASEEFSSQYARACSDRGHALAEQALAIADAPVDRDKAGRMDNAAVQRARLRVDTRKWFASKLAPRAFGDRVQAEVTGADGGPVAFALTPVDWDSLLTKVRAQPSSSEGE